ncbi:hypothetical protein BU24DRAFT_468339 [Aaosphaeria arxii CBS 175.79]|uniref:Uncharacterized protein n=1 Tax=Aaosphaeria arxii CBS 175.79 TaxID=1450172 RepID=A0A6A5X7K7_9PLEO|nr:uncharacterized protein BU24DRAFT_468339 [Aaosphaeria arxii CBS 175.79]KAF2008923.1 hypothetical protein BU24DRAFT_468339 [Aaosphaeria arxii CBS 175.79]
MPAVPLTWMISYPSRHRVGFIYLVYSSFIPGYMTNPQDWADNYHVPFVAFSDRSSAREWAYNRSAERDAEEQPLCFHFSQFNLHGRFSPNAKAYCTFVCRYKEGTGALMGEKTQCYELASDAAAYLIDMIEFINERLAADDKILRRAGQTSQGFPVFKVSCVSKPVDRSIRSALGNREEDDPVNNASLDIGFIFSDGKPGTRYGYILFVKEYALVDLGSEYSITESVRRRAIAWSIRDDYLSDELRLRNEFISSAEFLDDIEDIEEDTEEHTEEENHVQNRNGMNGRVAR